MIQALPPLNFWLTGPPDPPITWLLGGVIPKQKKEDANYWLYHRLLRGESNIPHQLRDIAVIENPAQIPILVCILSDDTAKYPQYRNLILLRTSLYRKNRRATEWPLPYLWESQSVDFQPAPDAGKPTIGFCGLSNAWRQPLIDLFSQSAAVQTDFILRDQFWGGKPHDEKLMNDFWKNIHHNAFTIASRGAGNFSMRFYQALSVGRIPVLLDTQMVLPFTRYIDWHAYIVMEKTQEACLAKVIALHNSGGLVQLQQAVYNMYHHFFTPAHYLNFQCKEISERAAKPKPWYTLWKR